ncbi:unnamed protein product [Symbiodinium sp. CCMP2456]|nr:unnamed protein product [Symbiodinium sp. CCMP2456]
MNPDEVVPAEAGEVNLLKVRPQEVLGIVSDAPPAVCYCVLSRPGGFLLVLPSGVFSPGVLQEAADQGFSSVIGPSTVITAPAVELAESGEWLGVYPQRMIEVTLIDFGETAAGGLEPLLEGLPECTPFVAESPMLFPLATSVTAAAVEWTANMEGDRGAGYITAEELLPEQALPSAPLLERRPKAEARPKKPTMAALASQQEGIMQALQALSTQVQQLASNPPPPQTGPAPLVGPAPLGGNRSALAAPVSAAIAASPAAPRQLASLLGAPPRAKAAFSVAGFGAPEAVAPGPLDGDPLDEDAVSGGPLASALLAQSKALTTLVAQLAGGGDPMSDLAASGPNSISVKGSAARMKLQRELHGRAGGFFAKVQEAARRRMEPTAQLGNLPEELQRLPVMTRYFERFGGFRDQRTWGLVMWQLAQAFDLLASDQLEGAKDRLALLIVMIDQTVLDAGQPDLGWILSLQEDPPTPLWLAVALSYVKEMETLSSKRSELSRAKAPSSGTAVDKEAAKSQAEESVQVSPPPAAPSLPPAAGSQVFQGSLGSEAAEGCALSALVVTPQPVPDEDRAAGPSSDCRHERPACTISTTTPPLQPGVSDASPFDGVPDFCSEFDFWSWAAALPRLVLSSRTSFAKFLRTSFCIRERGETALDTALVPLPVPDVSVFGPGSLPGWADNPGPSAKAKELVILASLAPVMSSDISAPFLSDIFCSDASMHRGAFCSSPQPLAVSSALWLCADKKGSYTMLDPRDHSAVDDEEEGEVPFSEVGPEKPLAFDFDVVCVFAGSEGIADCCASLGLRVSPILDLRSSVEFDVCSPVVQDWLCNLLWKGKVPRLSQAPCPEVFWVSRASPGQAGKGVASLLKGIVKASQPDRPPSPGLENLAINDVLSAGSWTVEGVWQWEKQRHINALETESVVSLLRGLAKSKGDSRPVCIVDSSCAKGALAKGRSSAHLLRPALRRAGAICVAGGLFPAYAYGPTRLNVSDDPTRSADLREAAGASLLEGLSERGIDCAAKIGGLSKCRANWVRLSALLVGPFSKESFLLALSLFPYRAVPHDPPALLYCAPVPGLHPAEEFAARALEEERLLPSVLGTLLTLLPGAGRVRFAREQEAVKYWTSGLYSQGPFRGLRSDSVRFPFATRLVCRIVAQVAPGFPFTTVALLHQVRSTLHKDRNNLKGLPSLVFPVSSFKDGQIFVEGGKAEHEISFDGSPPLRGELLQVCEGPVFLDGHRQHATLDWTGLRQVAVAFCIKDPWRVPLQPCRKARELGFCFPRHDRGWIRPGGFSRRFDATLGFPGEGPTFIIPVILWGLSWSCPAVLLGPRNAADRARAERRSPAGLPSGRVVLPRTGSYRVELAAAFSSWMVEVTGVSLQQLLDKKPFDAEAVADALVRYGRDLYGSGRPYWHYAETINSVTSMKPVLRRQVQAAWDLGFAWQADEPYSHHTAIPPAVLIAVITACLLWGWVREAGCFALAFGGVMRIGEVFAATRRCLILPKDVNDSQPFVLVKIEEPKTRHRGPRHQAAKVEASDLVQVITIAFSTLQAGEKLWPFSPQTLRKRFDTLLKKVGASPAPSSVRSLDLGSFRAGGATYLLQLTEDSELVRRRGRWASSKVMEVYLQEIAACTFLPALSSDQKRAVFTFAAGFQSVLRQAVLWSNEGIESNVWYRLWPGDLSAHER